MIGSDFIPQTTALLAAVGALFTGLASFISAVVSSRMTRSRMRDECDRRVLELNRTFRSGLRMADSRPLPHPPPLAPVPPPTDDIGERWSHLE